MRKIDFLKKIGITIGLQLGDKENWYFTVPDELHAEVFQSDVLNWLRTECDWSNAQVDVTGSRSRNFVNVPTQFHVYFEE